MPSIQNGSSADFEQWLSSAQPLCQDQPDYWIAVAARHLANEQYLAAIGCYWKAIAFDSNRAISWSQLGQSLRQLSTTKAIEPNLSRKDRQQAIRFCEERARSLLDLRMHLQRFGGKDERSQ